MCQNLQNVARAVILQIYSNMFISIKSKDWFYIALWVGGKEYWFSRKSR